MVMRAFLAGRSIRMRDTAAFFSLAFRYSRTLMSSASMPAKSRLLAYQRLAQLRLTARRKPVGWIFCPIVFLWPQLPTVTYTWHVRSEEHTSELQSQSNLLCRLLLEKKQTSLLQAGVAPPHAPEQPP